MSQLQSEMDADCQRLAFHYAALQASHEELLKALEETAERTSYGTGEGCWCNVEDIDSPASDHKPFCQQIRTALDSAAKLAPTRTKSEAK